MRQKTNKNPFVSVVIPAYNEELFLDRTLKSLQDQNYGGRWEVILVDNASTDKTAEIAKKYGVHVILESQKGVQYARQTGFEAAKGDLIASTDADNVLHKNWLNQLVGELFKNPDLVAAGGWFKFNKGFFVARFLMNNFSPPALHIYKKLTGKNILIGQNFIVRKEAFLKTKGFIGLSPMNEDLQFAQRLAQIGKVKLRTQNNWKILTSPRRWSNSFLRATYPYVINAIAFALTDKIVIKNFTNIREERTKVSTLIKGFAYITCTFIFIIAFLGLPISPVHAKINPVTKKARAQIAAGTKNVGHKINRSFINGRHHLYEEYREEKSHFLH